MKHLWLGAAVLLIAGMAVSARADVTIKKKMTFEGMMGMGGSTIEETEYIKPDMSCSEKLQTSAGGIMGKKGKETQDVQITRLDKGLVWNLNVAKKTYTEMPLESIKDLMDEAKRAPESPDYEETSDSDYEWKTDVKQIEAARNINGFDCRGIIGTANGVNKKDPSDKMRITYEYWMAEKAPAIQELDDYYKAYAKSLGVDEFQSQQAIDQVSQKYSNQFGGLFMDKIKDAGGFPIKVTMKVEKSGGDKNQGDDEAAAKAMAKMSGLFGSKKKVEKSADGMMTIFSTDTEVTGIEAGSVPGNKFEVPADYKKK